MHLFIVSALLSAAMLVVALGLRQARLHRQRQARAWHPSGGRRGSGISPYPHSVFFVIAAVVLLVVLVLVVVS